MRQGRQVLAAVLAGAALGGCVGGDVPFERQQAGSIGIDQETGLAYVAELDSGGVVVLDPREATDDSKAIVKAFVRTGERPERLLVRGGNIFVANRRSRTVTQIRASDNAVLRQIAVGAEPMGLEVTKDALVVANSMSGTVQAIDLTTFETKWEARLGDEVRAVAALDDGRIYVPGFKSGMLHVLDGSNGAMLKSLSFAQPPDESASFNRRPTMAQGIAVSADGRVYLPHSQTTKDELPPVTAGYYASGPAPAVAPGVTTVESDDDTVLEDDQPAAFEVATAALSAPPAMFRPTSEFSGPIVAALDGYGDYLYVVNHLSNNVAVVSTSREQFDDASGGFGLGSQGVLQVIEVGRGPTGIALSPDGSEAWVYNAFDHSITVLGAAPDGGLLARREIRELAPQTLSPSQQRGRILFHAADDTRMTLEGSGGVACASCHPGGREDGNTWAFAEGARNTPSLVGKHLKTTKPYHWDGQFDEFDAFQHVLEKRMGGTGISREEFNDILEWLDTEPAPDNPNRALDGTLTAEQLLGKEIFETKADCARCHNGDAFTDNQFYEVGTHLTMIPLEKDATGFVRPEDRQPSKANTPSLIGIFATGPYLHDGSKATLLDRVRDDAGGEHGKTRDLTEAEQRALVAYLQAL